MRTEFYISENNDFIREYMLKDNFPFPIGINSHHQLKKQMEYSGNSILHDFYFFADDKALPLQLGDRVILGGLHWKVTDKSFNYEKSTLIFKLEEE